LLQSVDGLRKSLAASPAQSLLKFWQLLPTQKCGDSNARYARGLFKVPLRKNRRDGLLFLSPELCAVAGHLRSLEDIRTFSGTIAC
jgi:hypothetical protein